MASGSADITCVTAAERERIELAKTNQPDGCAVCYSPWVYEDSNSPNFPTKCSDADTTNSACTILLCGDCLRRCIRDSGKCPYCRNTSRFDDKTARRWRLWAQICENINRVQGLLWNMEDMERNGTIAPAGFPEEEVLLRLWDAFTKRVAEPANTLGERMEAAGFDPDDGQGAQSDNQRADLEPADFGRRQRATETVAGGLLFVVYPMIALLLGAIRVVEYAGSFFAASEDTVSSQVTTPDAEITATATAEEEYFDAREEQGPQENVSFGFPLSRVQIQDTCKDESSPEPASIEPPKKAGGMDFLRLLPENAERSPEKPKIPSSGFLVLN